MFIAIAISYSHRQNPPPSPHKRIERVGSSLYVEVLLANLHAGRMRLVGEVSGSNDVASFGGAEYDDGGAAVVTSGIAHHLCAGGDEVAEMLVSEILSRVAHPACLAVHLYQGILLPSPRRFAIVGENEVPVVVFVASVTQIV